MTEPKYYRHLLVDTQDTYTFSLEPIMGQPNLVVRVSEVPKKPLVTDIAKTFKNISTSETMTRTITLDKYLRDDEESNCKFDKNAYYFEGGTIECVFYIAVVCDQECLYKLDVKMTQAETELALDPPKYLLNREYVTDTVEFENVNYYYYPVDTAIDKEIAFVLNKTYQDSFMVMNIQGNATDGYESWDYPTEKKNMAISREDDAYKNELITTCDVAIAEECEDPTSCVIIIGVYGNASPETQLDT